MERILLTLLRFGFLGVVSAPTDAPPLGVVGVSDSCNSKDVSDSSSNRGAATQPLLRPRRGLGLTAAEVLEISSLRRSTFSVTSAFRLLSSSLCLSFFEFLGGGRTVVVVGAELSVDGVDVVAAGCSLLSFLGVAKVSITSMCLGAGTGTGPRR